MKNSLAYLIFAALVFCSCAHDEVARDPSAEPVVQCAFKDGVITSIAGNKKKTHKEKVVILNQSSSQRLDFAIGNKTLFSYSPWGQPKFKVSSDLVVLDEYLSVDKKKAALVVMNRENKKSYKVLCIYP